MLNISVQNEQDHIQAEHDPTVHFEPGSTTTKRKKTSSCWKDFDEIAKDGSLHHQCRHCGRKFGMQKSGATTHLNRHLKTCPKLKVVEKGQRVISIEPAEIDEETITVANFKYDQGKTRKVLAKLIILDEKPFISVESKIFNLFCRVLQPRFEKVSRNTIKKDCMAVYIEEKEKLKSALAKVDRISNTTDTWTSNQTKEYMVITAQYVDWNWQMQKKILSFSSVAPPVNASRITEIINKCLQEWNLEGKVFTIIILDNASKNDSAIRTLKSSFESKGTLYMKGIIFHIRCSAHILNLIVQVGLHCINDIVSNICETVKYINRSHGRKESFNNILTQLGLSGKGSLKLDVCTRWNSTYEMINSALELQQALTVLKLSDANYTWLPEEIEWKKLSEVHVILKVFAKATDIFSGTKYPTSNMFLPVLWRIKVALFKGFVSPYEYIKDMTFAMKEKFDKYWSDCNVAIVIAAILDPRYKMMLPRFVFPKIYSSNSVNEELEKVNGTLHELYMMYESILVIRELQDPRNANEVVAGADDFDDAFLHFVQQGESAEREKSEIDVYLEEGCFLAPHDTPFDVLGWWKQNTLKFRVLSIMAREVLAIPMTSVASESAFSTSGRIISDYRSNLKPETVEALIWAQDWLRSTFYNPILEADED